MTTKKPAQPTRKGKLTGPAKDFKDYAELEFERRRNSEKDFDGELCNEAVELVLGKLGT